MGPEGTASDSRDRRPFLLERFGTPSGQPPASRSLV